MSRSDVTSAANADDAVASTLLANIGETKGVDRRGKIFASVRNDIRQANVYASTLSIEGLNWAEVDFPEDLPIARALTEGWVKG